jgi:sugar phosphate permease
MSEARIGYIGASSGVETPQVEERVYRKITLRIVPFLFVCYLAAYLDRVNVGFAKLQMLHDLNFSQTVYGFGAGIFFLGYVLFEVPSNVIMLRVGARVWIARIMITWGIISAAMVLVHSPFTFYVLRFLLGVAEAGFIPGILLYLTYWYPANRRGQITALFLAAIPTATIIGGPLSGGILNAVGHGAWGFAGWQWLFIIETVPSILLGIVTLLYLDTGVARARWLTEQEKRVVMESIAREEQDKAGHSHLSEAFTSPRVWLLGLIYFGIASGIYIISFWLPTIIKQTGVANLLTVGVLTAIPYAVAIVAMVVLNASGDRLRERRWHTILPALACAFGLVLTAWAGKNTAIAMVGLTLAAAGSSSAQASFWCIPAAFLAGAAAAAGIALVNSLGNISGFVSTFLVGWITDLTHSTASALYLFAGLVAACSLLILAIPGRDVNK